MKKRFLRSGALAVVLSAGLLALALTGCVSVPRPAPVSMPNKNDKPLAAGQDWLQEETAPTAKLAVSNFNDFYTAGGAYGAALLGVEGATLPEKAAGTQWSPVDVPAGREIALAVRFTGDGYTSEVEFTVPPLTAGKTYMLTFDTPMLKGKKMLVANRRYFVLRGAGAYLFTFVEIFTIVGIPDAMAEVFQPTMIKSDAPKEGPSLLFYERIDDGKRKNKISLKLVYQYSLMEMQGFPVP